MSILLATFLNCGGRFQLLCRPLVHRMIEPRQVDEGVELVWTHELGVCPANILPRLVLQLILYGCTHGRKPLQIGQNATLLQECDQHQINAERIKSLHLVTEARLVPGLQVEGQLDKPYVVGSVSAYQA